MNEQEFKELLDQRHEQRGVEFKRGGPRNDRQVLARVIRAVFGMTNLRDGGLVIVGVEEDNNGAPIAQGLSHDDVLTWNYDGLADSLAEYADPSVSFDLEIVGFQGQQFVVLHVKEFEDFPVLCKKGYEDVLRKGACYVRPRRKPETVEVSTEVDMRDLLELAIEKGVRKFVRQARTAGLGLTGPTTLSDTDLFNKQLGDLLGEKK